MNKINILLRASRTVWLALCFVAASAVQATPLQPVPSLDITGVGLEVAYGGTGMEGRSGAISVDIGGPVFSAVLYWAGRDRPCQEDAGGVCIVGGADDEVLLDGVHVQGDLIGQEPTVVSNGQSNSVGYSADVTDIVAAKGAGMHMFTVDDGDIENNLRFNGAGLLVVYVNQSNPNLNRVMVFEGLDFAYIRGNPAAAKVTEPVTFNFDSDTVDRAGSLTVFVGDAEASRPDRIDIDGNSILNEFDADEGDRYDVDTHPFTIPASATSSTTQLFSEANGFLSETPDSLLWEVAALALTVPENDEEADGRMTGGSNVAIDGVRVRGKRGGMTIHCDIELSNNIQVTWPATPRGTNTWHLDKEMLSSIMCIDNPDIVQAPPEAPLDTFIAEGIGKLNHQAGSVIRFTFIDGGEPGVNDYADIKIWAVGDDPDADTPFFSVAGFLTGGNIQAHYDQPHKNK